MVFFSYRSAATSVMFLLALTPELAISQSNLQHLRIEKISRINVMCGEWLLNSRMIPLNRPEITESGTMTCRSIYDSTYVECDVSLTNANGRKRGYRQFITYNPDSSMYEVLYLYTGTAMRVLEFGQMTDSGLVTRTTLKLPGGKHETIDAVLKIIHKDELYFESRSSETSGQVDYTCRYVRKK